MSNLTSPIDARSFATVLTADERAILDGRRPGNRRERITERDFLAMAGKRSYRSRRGEFRTFA